MLILKADAVDNTETTQNSPYKKTIAEKKKTPFSIFNIKLKKKTRPKKTMILVAEHHSNTKRN